MWNIYSFEFWLVFAGIVLVVWLRSRKRAIAPVYRGKGITILGWKLETPLSTETPLSCLLLDETKYGEDFQNKELPALPHNSECRCTLEKIAQRSEEFFQEKSDQKKEKSFNPEAMTAAQRRFLKYYLIVNHRDASEEVMRQYAELAENCKLDKKIQQQIIQYLTGDSRD